MLRRSLDNAVGGLTLYLAGVPGTGKSFVAEATILELADKYEFDLIKLDAYND